MKRHFAKKMPGATFAPQSSRSLYPYKTEPLLQTLSEEPIKETRIMVTINKMARIVNTQVSDIKGRIMV